MKHRFDIAALVCLFALLLACSPIYAQIPEPGGRGGGASGGATITGTDGAVLTKDGTNAKTKAFDFITCDPSICTLDPAVVASLGGYTIATTAPATCSVGALFFDSDATAGQNWFGCTSTNTWTQLGGATYPFFMHFITTNATSSSASLGMGFDLPSTNGPTLGSAGTTYRTAWLQFADGADNTVYFETRLHPGWNGGTVTFDFQWFAGSGGSAAQVAYIVTHFACIGNGGTAGSTEPSWTSLNASGHVAGAANANVVTSFTSALTGCAAGNLLKVRIVRDGDGTGGTDSLTANYNLEGIGMRYSVQ